MSFTPAFGSRRRKLTLQSESAFANQRDIGHAISVPPSRGQSPTGEHPHPPPPAVQFGQNHPDIARPPLPSHHRPRVRKNKPAQKSLDEFWSKFASSSPSKPYSVLPQHIYSTRIGHPSRVSTTSPATPITNKNAIATRPAHASYEEARDACRAKVEKIKSDCRRLNQKYRDPHFDIEEDFRRLGDDTPFSDCLMGLLDDPAKNKLRPQSVKRVEDIFEKPQFFVDGATASDVRQGREGDCWFMSAVATLSNKKGLIDKVCVARDEAVGVYGFVFHRDGEWISTVIDDKLYLTNENFHEGTLARERWLELYSGPNNIIAEREYIKTMQTGSRALYFAQCSDQNETWLPLLEKAYAKAHGDFSALDNGFVGEGIEDLTGGVTSELFSTDILDKKKFWEEELMQVNKQFLFGCGQMGGRYGSRNGILEKHAYSIMEAREIGETKLLKLRNPWGYNEWKGAWSDGSPEWTSEWMNRLNHTFGDDGVFWINYEDLLQNYQHFDRTRLFGPEWIITQQWTSVNVPWSSNYLDTRFRITLTQQSSVVIVLSQLDDRYFQGLVGQYDFQLQFRVHAVGARDEDYIVRSNRPYFMKRSVNTELELEAGSYYVIMKIIAKRYADDLTVEEAVRQTCQHRREKLLSLGLSYDLAHAKGQFRELELEKLETEREARRKAKEEYSKRQFEARVKQRKKEKLRNLRRQQKEEERMLQRMAKEAEQRRNDEEDASIQRQMEQFNMSTEPQEYERGAVSSPPLGPDSGLGLRRISIPPATVRGVSNRAATLPSRTGNRPASLSVSSRPGSPFLPSLGTPGSARRNTLTAGPSNLRASSPTPDIRVQRASIAETGRLTLSDISDDGLSWDSELDGPESEDENDVFAPSGPSMPNAYGYADYDRPNRADQGIKQEGDESEDAATKDPWNAVVVVGLRVYSKDPGLTIHTHRPGHVARQRRRSKQRKAADRNRTPTGEHLCYDNNSIGVQTDADTASECGSSAGNGSGAESEFNPIRGLDVDDISKDASGESILSPIGEYPQTAIDTRSAESFA